MTWKRTIDELRANAVVVDAMAKPDRKVTFVIDGGFAPDGKARLSHVLGDMPLQKGQIEDAWPIGENRMKVQASADGRNSGSTFGLGGGL